MPEPADLPRLFESWVGTYRNSPWAGTVPNTHYRETQMSTIEHLLGRGSKILVASNAERPEQVVGWICFEDSSRGDRVVHYLFTNAPFTKRGVATALLAAAEVPSNFTYTHRTPGSACWPRAKHNPGIARRKNP
jgi:hypothetical protein